jgi:hypothetical protein
MVRSVAPPRLLVIGATNAKAGAQLYTASSAESAAMLSAVAAAVADDMKASADNMEQQDNP